jgi:hypothetical protein
MKHIVSILSLLAATSALAKSPQSIVCREDRRLDNGGLREVILSPTAQGYVLQTQEVTSLNSPELKIETWAQNLKCRLDEKSPVAFCQTPENIVVNLSEHRNVFFESLEADKKTTIKSIDISLLAHGIKQKSLNFSTSHCQVYGGEA